MTIAIPNYLIKIKEPSLIKIAPKLYIETINKHYKKVLLRNTMHGLTLITAGDKKIELGDKQFQIKKDEAIFFTQGNYFSNQNSKDYDSLTVFFDDIFILDFIKKYKIELNQASKKIIVLNYQKEQNIFYLFSSIKLSHQKRKSKHKEILKLKIELLFLEFYECYPNQMKSLFAHIVSTSNDRMRYILEENIDIIQKVSDMHQLMQMSPSSFQKQFQKNFNTSPKIWLDQQRMEKAKFLLCSTNKSVTEIATECGYSTASWFIVQFKKYCKTTAKEYRIKNQYK